MLSSGAALFWPRRDGDNATRPQRSWAFLSSADHQALLTLMPALLGESSVAAIFLEHAGQGEFISGVDWAISLLPPATRDDLRQLFDLLSSPGGRFLLLGLVADWRATRPEELAAGLEGWRRARLGVLRSAYEGLRDIVFAVWYGQPKHGTSLADFGWKGV
jgi:hypothetical protein